MASIKTKVDIEPEDFLDGCSSYDIREVIDWLKKMGYLKMLKHIDTDKLVDDDSEDLKWNTEVGKLMGNRWKLTKEQEEEIIKITKTL